MDQLQKGSINLFMPVTKKNTIKKTSARKKVVKAKKFDDNGVVFFPEKLAKANALLSKAILLPRGKNKK
jgi:hypothetical protein